MPSAEAVRPIPVHQEDGPNLTIIHGLVPYYTEVLGAIAGKDMPELPFVAAAASYGANVNQPEFNEPVDKAVAVAHGLDEATKVVNSQEVPMVGFASFRWVAGISSPDNRLRVVQGTGNRDYMSVEIGTNVPVLHGSTNSANSDGMVDNMYAGGQTYDKTANPDKTFAVDTPSLVVTDAKRPAKAELATEVKYAIRQPYHQGILAVGSVATSRLLEAVAQEEFGVERKGFYGFTESSSLLMLAYFREQGHQLAASRATFVREAGQRVISALIAGTAMSLDDHRRERTTNTGYIVKRLRAIDFATDDYEPIVDGVTKNMMSDQSYEHFDDLARLNGCSVEAYAKGQVTSFFTNLLGVGVD